MSIREPLTGSQLYPMHLDEPTDAERAQAAIEKLPLEDLPWRNPWRKIWSSANVNGPSAILINFGDPSDMFDNERAAMVWDSQLLASGPHAVREGTSAIFEVADKAGDVLELWATDDIPVSAQIEPLSAAKDLQKQVADANKDAGGPGILDRYFGTIRQMGFLGTVLAGVAVYIAAPHVASWIKAAK